MKILKSRWVAALVAIFGILFLMLSFSCGKEEGEVGEEGEEIVEEIIEFGPTMDLGEMIINLSDTGQARYAKMVVVLEFSDEIAAEHGKIRDPQIRDIVTEIIGEKVSVDILSLESRNILKNEIIERINAVLPEGTVREVYFTTVIVQ